MKRISFILVGLLMVLGLTACGGNSGTDSSQSGQTIESKQSQESVSNNDMANTESSNGGETEPQEDKDVLVVYFSATGTTKSVAEKIAAITEGDLYEITAAQAYTDDDLNWHDSSSRSTIEQNDPSARPEIGSDPISLEGYDTIYIGYPIWWGEEPRIMDTFVEGYSFEGITMIPFCTSSSSGIGRSGINLAENAGSGNWLDGQRFGAGTTEADLSSWIEGLQ